MGLMQCACETYDRHQSYVGKYEEGKEPLAPISHIVTAAQIEITINQAGEFIQAVALDKKEPKIIIPVTEESAGRTSAPIAHPLCDQIQYLSPAYGEKYTLFVNQLKEWEASEYSHPMISAVLNYVIKGEIIEDLRREKCIELSDKGLPKNPKLMVRWRVVGLGEESGACWKNRKLFALYSEYALSKKEKETKQLCMITGKYAGISKQHPKGIVSLYGNAKLISANDNSGFTYRGRFSEDWQAETISYEASQKAHLALKWLAANQGVYFGGRCFLCWNPEGVLLPEVSRSLRRFNGQEPVLVVNASQYKEDLQKCLKGWKDSLPAHGTKAVIAAFDAATTGRLSLTYFRELDASDFEQRLYDWEYHCAWFNGKYGVQSPSVFEIVKCAYGTERSERNQDTIAVDDRILKQQVQNLISCRIDGARIPLDLKNYLTERASSPQKYHSKNNYLRVLHTACAVIRKYYHDYKGREIDMALNPMEKDRSYQFGRLLAVMEKAERDTYGSEESREPNAIRMQSVFTQRPLSIANQLQGMLDRAYFPRLKPASRSYYRKLLSQIVEQISLFEMNEINKPLSEMYLIGYYLQRNDLYTKKEEN